MKTLTIQLTMPPRFRLIDGPARTQAEIHAAEAAAMEAAMQAQLAFRPAMDTLAAHRARVLSARKGWANRRAKP